MVTDRTEVKDKKRKKHKERCLEEVVVDEKVVHKEEGSISTKRKKKNKDKVREENERNDITEVEENMENGEKQKKNEKKKSKDISALDGEQHMTAIEIIKTESSETAEHHAGTDTKRKKKKKKQSQQQEDTTCEEVAAPVCEGTKQPKQRGSLAAAETHGDISSPDLGEEASVATLKNKKKKKKREKPTDEENRTVEENGAENPGAQSADTTDRIPAEGETEKKRRKKAAAEDEETGVPLEQQAPEERRQEKKKKKKKRKEENLEEDPSTTCVIQQAEPKEGKRKKAGSGRVEDATHAAAGADLGTLEEENAEAKAKKRHKRKDISVNTETAELNLNPTEGENKKQKKKKRKKEQAEEAAQPALDEEREVEEGEATGTETVNGRKRQKRPKAVSEACTVAETPTPKKKKKASEETPPTKAVKQEENPVAVSGENQQEVTEVVFLSEKPGNQDEILIDQERRLALQRDIDKESQPKTAFGQWGTATFEKAEQQQKFLRLMGGFKKSSQSLGSSAGRPNMAMGKEEQQSFQQKLLGQFQQAQSRRTDFSNQGAGLGFVAPSNKKFAIDVNASRSMKFDD